MVRISVPGTLLAPCHILNANRAVVRTNRPRLVLPVERGVVGRPLVQSGSTSRLCGVPREQSSDQALQSLEMGMKGAEREM